MASRKKLVQELLSTIEPYFYNSGYNKYLDPKKGLFGPKRPLQVYRPKDPVEFDGFVLQRMIAISEDGLITDAYGGGCIVESFECFPIEDLKMLLEWVKSVK